VHKITAQGLTDVGQQRDHNEDAFACADEVGFYVVCDGMGGHASGELASRIAVQEVVRLVDERLHAAGAGDVSEALVRDAVRHANERVYVEGLKDAKTEGMGTTIVALFPRPEEIILAHVGDSRIYRLNRAGSLEQLTRDHSLLNEQIDAGILSSPAEIARFTRTNVISRALGITDEVKVDTRRVPRRAGDIFLLCTDGLTDLVSDGDIEAVLDGNRDDLEEALACLVRMSNARGGKDNITVLVVRVDDEDDYLAETLQEDATAEVYRAETPPVGTERPSDDLGSETDTTPNIPKVVRPPRGASGPFPAASAPPSRPLAKTISPVKVHSGATGFVSTSTPSWAEEAAAPSIVIDDD